jgi:hypothetical protein
MSVWYGGRLFRPVKTSGNSHTSQDTIFKYEQRGWLVTATYAGGEIEFGHLIGVMDEDGVLDLRYHHRGLDGSLYSGTCLTTPEKLTDNKLRLHEKWTWTNGESGTSILEEI